MSPSPDQILANLLDADGVRVVAELADLDERVAGAPGRRRNLVDRLGDDGARLALLLAEGRRRARAKFPDADRLLFTPELVAQATAHPVALRRALRFRERGVLLDLGCGAGGDLTRCAAEGATSLGLERDALAAALARENLRALGLKGEVITGSYPEVRLPAHDALFVDPARRRGPRGPDGPRRLFRAEDLSPSPTLLNPLLSAASSWAVKWGPGMDLRPETLAGEGGLLAGIRDGAWSLEVVSWNGSVREAVFLGGEVAADGPRAVVLHGDVAAAETWTCRGDPQAPPPPCAAPGEWILEPDGALLRADAMNVYAAQRDLALLAPGIAYLTGDAPPADPGARCWRRLATVPWSRRRVRSLLRDLGAGTLTVKTRGVALRPEAVRAMMDLAGEREFVLFLHRGEEGPVAHVCLPMGEEESAT